MVTGTGIALDSNWDIDVSGESGDIAIEEGSKELQKDLALALARAYDGAIGGVVDRELLSDLELQTKKLLRSDPRVARVVTVDVGFDQAEQRLRVNAQVESRSYFTTDADNDIIEITFEDTLQNLTNN